MGKLITGMLLLILSSQTLTAHQDGSDKNNPDMFQILNRASMIDREVLSPAQAINISEVIARGKIVAVMPGRSIEHKNGYSRPIVTVYVAFKLGEVMKGEHTPGDIVYFEYIYGLDPSELDKNKYTREMLVMLRRPGWDRDAYYFIEADPSRNISPYELTTEAGVMIEDAGTRRLRFPLADGFGDPIITSDTLDGAAEEIETVLDSNNDFGFGPPDDQ